MSVGKFIELSGQSSQSYEDAIRQAVEQASSTIRNIRSVWAKEFEAVVENNQVTQFRVVVKIAFVLDEGAGAGQVNPAVGGRMAQTRGPSTNPQQSSSASQGKGTAEGVVGQAAEAAHNVAESASRLAACAGYLRDRRALRARGTEPLSRGGPLPQRGQPGCGPSG